MLLDTSAIVAVLLREPLSETLREQIDAARMVAVSSVTMLEAQIVLTNRMGRDALPTLEAFVSEVGAQIVPFTEVHWRLAAEAFIRFGKGRHPAALNFGDCIVYATARQTQLPLLFCGSDFARTDLGS